MQKRIHSNIKLVCLVIIAMAVVYSAMFYLHEVLIPFVIAVAFSCTRATPNAGLGYPSPLPHCSPISGSTSPWADLLTPLITLFTCGNRAPRPLGVLLAFVTIVGIIFAMGVVLLQAVHLFAVRQDTYRTRMEELLESIFELVKTLQAIIPLPKGVDSVPTTTSRLEQVLD